MSFEAVRKSIERIDPSRKSIQGFDPSTLALTLFKMRDDDVSKKHNIVLMIAAYIERGNTVSKMDKNSSPIFANTIKQLIPIYGLVDKPGSNPIAITLSRVAESFPFITCSYCSLVAKHMTVSVDEMHSICEGYPKYMMCQAFTALIPNGEPYTQTLLKAHALFLYNFSLKISNHSMKKKTVQDTWKYMIIVHQRSYMEESKKKDLLKEEKILGINGLQNAVLKASEIFENKYQKYLENDEY